MLPRSSSFGFTVIRYGLSIGGGNKIAVVVGRQWMQLPLLPFLSRSDEPPEISFRASLTASRHCGVVMSRRTAGYRLRLSLLMDHCDNGVAVIVLPSHPVGGDE